ncbi:MAG: NAD/NADP octopine/nopaline dehydrogenase family protein [Planctomycetota bacterium]
MDGQKPVYCVLGAGHGGLAMAGHLGLMGFRVRLFNRKAERLEPVQDRGGVLIEGEEINGFGPVEKATGDAGEAIRDADILMVVVPASGHQFMAEACAPHLRDGQMVILHPGRTFGALEFQQVLRERNVTAKVLVAEAQSFIYASRAVGPGTAKIFRIKNSIPLACIQAYRTPEVLDAIQLAYPQFVPGDNILKTSFNNIGAIFHPAITLLNTGWIEDDSDFEFYHEGVTHSVAKILEDLDSERVKVAAGLGIQAMTAREWLYFAYDAAGRDLYSAMRSNLGYRGIQAPRQTEMRYITEDVPFSLVPMVSVGRQLGIRAETMEAIIRLASRMHGRDYWAEGRTVERLGIAGKSLREIRLLAIGEEESAHA